jgi:hypothetical protein
MDRNTVKDNYLHYIHSATMSQIMQAATWYADAQSIAKQLSVEYDVNLDVVAAVIAAFSPRTRWAQNVLNAELFLSGKTVPTLGNNIRMAESALELGIPALKGRKTNSFAYNIAGDMNVVTIDVWMIRAAGYDRKDANKSMYDLMESVIVELAAEFSVSPAQLQALIWIVVRGSNV